MYPHMPSYDEEGVECTSGGCSSSRIVSYVATGAESPAGFTVPIGATLAAATYHVGFFGCEANAGAIVPVSWSFPAGSKTTTQFEAEFSGDELTAGATYKFQIVEA